MLLHAAVINLPQSDCFEHHGISDVGDGVAADSYSPINQPPTKIVSLRGHCTGIAGNWNVGVDIPCPQFFGSPKEAAERVAVIVLPIPV
jgi:hypothetical protein